MEKRSLNNNKRYKGTIPVDKLHTIIRALLLGLGIVKKINDISICKLGRVVVVLTSNNYKSKKPAAILEELDRRWAVRLGKYRNQTLRKFLKRLVKIGFVEELPRWKYQLSCRIISEKLPKPYLHEKKEAAENCLQGIKKLIAKHQEWPEISEKLKSKILLLDDILHCVRRRVEREYAGY